MKKQLSTLLVAAVATGIIFCSGANLASAENNGWVSVQTTADTEIAPDIVEINIQIKTDDTKSLQKATNDNKEISDKIYTELSAMIDTEKGDFIKTKNFNASPIYSYKNDKKTIIKYEVTNSVIVHTKAIQDAGKIIDKAILFGATNINDVKFSISSYDQQCNNLLAIAAKKARTRANTMVNAAGGTLTGIKSINGSCSTNQHEAVPYRILAKNASMDSVASGTESISSPVQSGIVKLIANINASYFVK